MLRLHVSPGQQTGAMGIDEGVAIGTEGSDVSQGGRAGALAARRALSLSRSLSFFVLRRVRLLVERRAVGAKESTKPGQRNKCVRKMSKCL